MHFDIPAAVEQRRRDFRDFLDREIRPVGDARDVGGPLSRPELDALVTTLQPSGIMHASLPESVGGTNRSFLERILLAEEFARAWPSLAVTIDSHNIVVEIIARQGEPWMQDRYVPEGISGRAIMGDMMSEPEAGSDTRNLSTRAERAGDDWIVNGTKMWTTNGVWADVAMLTAVSEPSQYQKDPRRGVVHLLVDKRISPWRARDLPIIGLKAGTTGHIVFESCRVPGAHLFHPDDAGYTQNLVVRGWARILLGAWAIGIMQAAIDDAVAFARERRTFGKPIAAHQMIQDMVAQMHVDLETSRLLTYKAAWLMDQGRRCDLEQSTAKLHACEVVKRVTDSAIQILGGRGLTTDEGFRTERLHRDARFLAVAEGTSQIMKLIIGRRLLGVSAL